jgi:hypothetical protein
MLGMEVGWQGKLLVFNAFCVLLELAPLEELRHRETKEGREILVIHQPAPMISCGLES